MLAATLRESWQRKVTRLKRQLDLQRAAGDPLKVELAEAALNDLLEHPPTKETDKTE